MGIDLSKLAQVYLKREEDRTGVTAQNQAAQQQQLADLVKRAQLRKLVQELDLAPAEQASQIDLRTAQTEAARALAGQRETPRPMKSIERTVDMGDRVRIIHTDGTVTEEPKGAAPRRAGSGSGGADGGVAANPFNVTDAQGNVRLAVRDKHAPGGIRFVNDIGGTRIGPGPTAEQRNTEYQAQAVEPALALVSQSLDEFGKSIEGGLPGGPSAMIPGTDAYYAKTKFQEQAKALLGAIVARQAGEGSRLSDEDRKSYSQAATIVNNVLTLPGGVDAAKVRLQQVTELLSQVMQRRKLGSSGVGNPTAPTPTPAPSGGSSFRVVGVR